MNVPEAKAYFQELGAIARSEPDRGERRRFFSEMRSEDPAYQDAFNILRVDQEGLEGMRTIKGAVMEIAGKRGVKTNTVQTTSYGVPVVEFNSGGEFHTIVPIRITNFREDYYEASMISATRSVKTRSSGKGYYPFIT